MKKSDRRSQRARTINLTYLMLRGWSDVVKLRWRGQEVYLLLQLLAVGLTFLSPRVRVFGGHTIWHESFFAYA